MSLFEKLFSSFGKAKSYDKYGDILKKAMTTKEQRLEAIEALEHLSPEQSVPQLLKRFEMVIESGLQDTKEKELCMSSIVSGGDKSKGFIEEVLAKNRRISWVIKCAEKLYTKEEYIELLLNSLNTDMVIFDEDILERNEEIMLALKDIKDEKIVGKIAPFLSSRDENVRMAALECLEEQAASSAQAKEILLNLAKEILTDDNSRFLGVVQSVLKKHNWL